MPSLGNLWWTMGIKDLTDADLKKINEKLKNVGSEILLTPKLIKNITDILPKGVQLELDPRLKSITNEALAKAAKGKVMRVAVMPLLTHLRKALKDATKDNPPEMEVGVQSAKLRKLIEGVLHLHGFMINISTVNDNYTKVVQQKLNGTRYTVKIHADAREIARSVQASLMQMQSRYFGLQVSRDILYRSIDEALGQKRFNINIAVQNDQARRAVQDALFRAQVMGKDQALSYQRMQTGELKAAQAELTRLKAAHMGAADAARTHASASAGLGGAMGSNIKIAGELGSAMASLYSIHAAKEFLSQVIEIGGELEHQKIAMDTIFGDKGKTNELFGQIKGLARTSPFGVMELSKSVKALSAYGVEYNEIYETAKRLADISAATSVDINRLILAFGKTKSRGFLDGLEAKQFAYANIPIYEMVRKKLEELEGQAVTTAEVMARMKKREIGFDIVKDVLWDITDPGGKFYNMQEALAGSVKTSWKLVRDDIELMFGEIAESNVGEVLKDVAEILRSLTRNWKTLGVVIAGGVVSFGLYKTALLAANMAMERGAVSAIKKVASQRLVREANMQAALSYRQLTEAEGNELFASRAAHKINGLRILSRQRLTLREAEALLLTKTITREQILLLVALKRVSAEDAKRLMLTTSLTSAERQALLVEIERASNAKRSTVIWAALNAKIKGVVTTLKSFALASLPLVAIGAVMALWQKHNDEMDKAKEIGDNLFTKAEEGAKNLSEILSGMKPLDGATDYDITQNISTLEQAIKDYSSTPIEDINRSLVDQDGHLRTLAERYEFLTDRVRELKQAYDAIDNRKFSDIAQGAIEDTGGNWSNLFLNDNIITNASDYSNALKKRKDNIAGFLGDYRKDIAEALRKAREADGGFRSATEGMQSYEEQLSFLVEHTDKFRTATSSLNAVLDEEWGNGGIHGWAGLLGNKSNIEDAYDELIADTEKFVEQMNSRLRLANIDPAAMSDEQKTALQVSLKSILDQMEGAGDEAKAIIAKKWEEAWGVTLMEDKIGPALQDRFRTLAANGVSSAIDAAVIKLQHEGYEKLSDAEKQLVNGLMAAAQDDVMEKLGITSTKMQRYLLEHPLSQIITLTYATEANAPSDLAKQLVAQRGYQGLNASTNTLVNRWAKGNSVYGARNAAQQALQAVDDELTAAKKAGVGIEKAQAEWDKVYDALAYLGWTDLTTKDRKSDKGAVSKKDEFAESLKQRFKDIKDAWSEFQKWSKVEGREAAAQRVGESGLFSTLSADKIPQTIEDYRTLVKGLEDELRLAGVKGAARESLLNDLLKQLLDIDKTVVDEQLKIALDAVSKEAERQLADWNLFDKIRKATGNQDLAMSVAFGMNPNTTTDYSTLVKKQFAEVANQFDNMKGLTYDMIPDASYLTDAPNEVKKAWEDTTKKLQQYAREQKDAIADILSEYQSLQDKLAKIDSERDRKKRIVDASTMSEPEKAAVKQRIDVEADYQKFTQSNEYLQFFAGVYALTEQEATRIGDLIEQNLNRRLQAGTISAEEYYKEIERVRKQLDKLRNVKSDAMTFMTGGIKGLNQKRTEENDAVRLKKAQEIADLEEQIQKAIKDGDKHSEVVLKERLRGVKEELSVQDKIRDTIIKNQQQWQSALDVANLAANIAGGLSDAFNSIRDMADALGVDTSTGAWDDIAAVLDTFQAMTDGVSKMLQSAMSGNVGGILSGAVNTITMPFTIWGQLHDKKLQKMIERSKEAAQIMQNQYDILEKQMANFLGNAATMNTGVEGGAYGKQRELMQGQLAELEKQRQAEIDKKKTDDSVVEDYDRQIEEMKIAIRDFAIETAKDLYGIDLKSWSSELGDALLDAWKKGENGADAFKKKAGEILGDVMNNVLKLSILEPMMKDVQKFLFGEDGKSGAFGASFELTPDKIDGLAAKLMAGMEDVDAYTSALEQLEKVLNEKYGLSMKGDDESKSGLSAGIQSITEDTAGLLASYVNAIRASVAMNETRWERLLNEAVPRISALTQSQLDCQRQIAENTRRNAVAAEAIMKSNDDISRLLVRVTQGGAKFNVN